MILGVVGSGLIGASFLLLAKATLPKVKLVCYEPNQDRKREAIECGVDVHFCDCLSELSQCDIVFVATPPRTVCSIVLELLEHENSHSLIVDLASTKDTITQCIKLAMPECQRYIGGHPLSGGNTAGATNASKDVLRGSTFILTTNGNNSAIDKVERVLTDMCFKVILMDSKQHDQLLALSSHLPHFISYAYSLTLAHESGASRNNLLLSVSSRSTRAISGFASENIEMWADIFFQNQELSSGLDKFVLELLTLRAKVQNKNPTEAHKDLTEAHAFAANKLNKRSE